MIVCFLQGNLMLTLRNECCMKEILLKQEVMERDSLISYYNTTSNLMLMKVAF